MILSKEVRLVLMNSDKKMLDNTVKVLTVHSAKGLEADNVVVVGVSGWSKRGEERRIAYVAATRARKQLIWTKEFNKKTQNFKMGIEF